MPAKPHATPRQLKPELEHEFARSPDLGYEASTDVGFVRCLSHGFPTPLARWHYHDEYELHLITATSGKVFVGDWIAPFQPGQLVLTGPRLPHNWVSTDLPVGGVAERDLVIQFSLQMCQATQNLGRIRSTPCRWRSRRCHRLPLPPLPWLVDAIAGTKSVTPDRRSRCPRAAAACVHGSIR